MTAMQAGVSAFQKAYQQENLFDTTLQFSSYAARAQRDQIAWAYFKNNAYDQDLHAWARTYKTANGLYKYTRAIYNPARALALLWQSLLAGGILDPNAGDGTNVKSCLPIQTENENLRPAIARVWRDSNMVVAKDEYTLFGTIFGTTGWRIHDDPERGKVYAEPLRSNMLYDVVKDNVGNVKGYTLTELRLDPTTPQRRVVTFSERATRDGEYVVYETFKDDKLFAWDGVAAQWEVPYGFVPLVVVKHSGVGEWGESEFGDDLSPFREVDEQASLINDYVRRFVQQPLLLAGVDAPNSGTKPTTAPSGQTANQAADDRYKQQDRQEIPIFYGPQGAQSVPLLASLDIAAASANLDKLLAKIEGDHPELRIEKLRVSGGLTGRALELAREPAVKKAQLLRTNYDRGIVAMQQMCVAIGGYRGYKGYEGFGLDSYAAGTLEHSIGERAVYEASESDTLDRKKTFWDIVNVAAPLVGERVVLKDLGWDDAKIEAELGAEIPNADEPPPTDANAQTLDEVKSALEQFRAVMGENMIGANA